MRDATPDSIRSLHVEVMHLSRLVDDLYQLSLFDVGALTYRKSDLDLAQVLRHAVESFRGEFEQKEIDLQMQLPSASRFPVYADGQRLLQLFDNLLDNALKYTDPGGELVVRLKRQEGRAVVDFQDSAPGVEPAELSKLFDRLFRVENWRNRTLGGAGLGLSICKNIVEAHEGTIEAHAAPQGGVWIKMSSPDRRPCMSGKILIVEDEEKLATLLRSYLKQSGFESHWIGDGVQVVSYLREEMPDLMLLDLMLPGRNGLDICKEVRSFSNLPIIMITARVEEIDRLLGLELGADDYICKPFSPREVVARVKTVLRRTTEQQPVAAKELMLDPDRYRAVLHGQTI